MLRDFHFVEALENRRTVVDARRARPVRSEQIVAHKIEFREPGLFGEIRLVQVGHPNFSPVDRQNSAVSRFIADQANRIAASLIQLSNSTSSI